MANHVDELGLTGVGWTMPTGTEVKASNLSSVSRERQAAGVNIEMEDAPESQAPAMGPTPTRSDSGGSTPDWRTELRKNRQSGLEPAERPDIIELMDVLEDMDPPVPAQAPPALTPWPRHGCVNSSVGGRITASPACAPKTSGNRQQQVGGREGTALEVWLDSLFSADKLVKSTAGTRQDGALASGCPVDLSRHKRFK